MATQSAKYLLTGTSPLIVHNPRLVNKLDPLCKEFAKVKGKRKKTDADDEHLLHLQFLASMYLNKDGSPVMPADNIRACLIGGGKKQKDGKLVAEAIWIVENPEIQYEGPRDAEDMWQDERFPFIKQVRIGQSRVMSARCWFQEWSIDVDVEFEDELLNSDTLDHIFEMAGRRVGLGDWRPEKYGQYGTFNAERAA